MEERKSNSTTSVKEKAAIEQVEDVEVEKNKTESGVRFAFDDAEDRRIMRMVDLRLFPILCILYALSLVDRTNIGSARTLGMSVTLRFPGTNHYSVALLVFFCGYFLFDIPSTLALRKLKPRNFLTLIIVSWGATTLGIGFVKDWRTLTVLRAFLGCFEAGFFPACVYLISSWFKRYEVQTRLSAFYMASALASGFASIIAYGLSRMDGVGGLEGWRWIFIMLGIITMTAGAIGWFLIVDFPNEAKFLTAEERAHVIARLNIDRGDGEHDGHTFRKVITYLCDIRLWFFALAFGLSTAPAYALAYFIPVILTGLGFSVALANILAAPPYVGAVFLALTTSFLSDKVKLRSPFMVVHSVIAIIGFAVVMRAPTNEIKLFGTFLAVAGTQTQIPFIIGFSQNNIIGSSKRAVASGLTVAFGSLGGIAASTVFREQDFPEYHPGLIATMIFHTGIILIVIGFVFHYRSLNNKLDRESPISPRRDTETEAEAARRNFRYTL